MEKTSVYDLFLNKKIEEGDPVHKTFEGILTKEANHHQILKLRKRDELKSIFEEEIINKETFNESTLNEKMNLKSGDSKLAIYFFKVSNCKINKDKKVEGLTYSYYKQQQNGKPDIYEKKNEPYYLYIGKVTSTTIRQRLKEHLGFGHSKTGALRLNEEWIEFDNLEIHILTFEPTGKSEGGELVYEIAIDALEKISIKFLKPIIGKY